MIESLTIEQAGEFAPKMSVTDLKIAMTMCGFLSGLQKELIKCSTDHAEIARALSQIGIHEKVAGVFNREIERRQHGRN